MSKVLGRRDFIKLAGIGTLSMAIGESDEKMLGVGSGGGYLDRPSGQASQVWPAEAGEYRLEMIVDGHIDAVWLWPWNEAMSVVPSTFRSVLDRMKANPDFTFTEASAQFYIWVGDSDPEMLAEIRQHVAEGCWQLAGGWWVEPDVNMPKGESLARPRKTVLTRLLPSYHLNPVKFPNGVQSPLLQLNLRKFETIMVPFVNNCCGQSQVKASLWPKRAQSKSWQAFYCEGLQSI